jgi:hypothetical protein
MLLILPRARGTPEGPIQAQRLLSVAAVGNDWLVPRLLALIRHRQDFIVGALTTKLQACFFFPPPPAVAFGGVLHREIAFARRCAPQHY